MLNLFSNNDSYTKQSICQLSVLHKIIDLSINYYIICKINLFDAMISQHICKIIQIIKSPVIKHTNQKIIYNFFFILFLTKYF